jgi:DNA (cytosine-5)-methyltransferase 1
MSRPRLLDLFACAGGAGTGYERAGFDVYAVDIEPQPNNPHPFHQGDALEVLCLLILGGSVDFTHRDGTVEWLVLEDFVGAHTSPPCQGYSATHRLHGKEWPKLIAPTRELLEQTGLPWVIENVVDALPEMVDPVTLCGAMFDGLHTYRHRLLETGGGLELAEAIPPAYTHHVGTELLNHLALSHMSV